MSDTDFTPYLERFHSEYASPDDAGMPLDDEGDDGYFWTAPRHSTEDAVNELFENELSESDLEELAAELNGEYPNWARRDEL